MPGRTPKLISGFLRCPECGKPLDADDCACGFTCSIPELRRRRDGIPEYVTAHRPRGVWIRQDAGGWTVTAFPLSIQTLGIWLILAFVTVVFAGAWMDKGPNLMAAGFAACFWIILGPRAIGMVSIRCRGNTASVSTGLWNLPRPRRIDWRKLHAIRLRVRMYSNDAEQTSIVLDADDIVEFGNALGEDQFDYVLWTLYRQAIRRAV